MRIYGGSGRVAPRILNLGTSGVEWSVSRSGRFTNVEIVAVEVGQRCRTDLSTMERRKSPSSAQNRAPNSLAIQPVA
jgi:hypothetical protein